MHNDRLARSNFIRFVLKIVENFPLFVYFYPSHVMGNIVVAYPWNTDEHSEQNVRLIE